MSRTLKLPVYLVLDCSGSMGGEPIKAIEEAVRELVDRLRSNPGVYVSIMTFNHEPRQVVPLQRASDVVVPELTAAGITRIGAALHDLGGHIDREVRGKDEWFEPQVIIMTDGGADDDWEVPATSLRDRSCRVVAIAVGDQASASELRYFANEVARLPSAEPEVMRQTLGWIADAIAQAAAGKSAALQAPPQSVKFSSGEKSPRLTGARASPAGDTSDGGDSRSGDPEGGGPGSGSPQRGGPGSGGPPSSGPGGGGDDDRIKGELATWGRRKSRTRTRGQSYGAEGPNLADLLANRLSISLSKVPGPSSVAALTEGATGEWTNSIARALFSWEWDGPPDQCLAFLEKVGAVVDRARSHPEIQGDPDLVRTIAFKDAILELRDRISAGGGPNAASSNERETHELGMRILDAFSLLNGTQQSRARATATITDVLKEVTSNPNKCRDAITALPPELRNDKQLGHTVWAECIRSICSELRSNGMSDDAVRPVEVAKMFPAANPDLLDDLLLLEFLSHQSKSLASADGGGDTVECSIFAPAKVRRGRECLVQAFLHLPKERDDAAREAQDRDPGSRPRGRESLSATLQRGEEIAIALTGPDNLAIEPTRKAVRWRGDTTSASFRMAVAATAATGDQILTATVYRQEIPIGTLQFVLKVTALEPWPRSKRMEASRSRACQYSKVFASYARSDLSAVLPRLQVLPSIGIEVLLDVLSLFPGDLWEKETNRRIETCDLFLLFWSAAAKGSTWVRKETGLALERQKRDAQGLPSLKPMILEHPHVVEPWDELKHLHFFDAIMFAIGSPVTT